MLKKKDAEKIAALYRQLQDLEQEYEQELDRIVLEHKKKVQAILDKSRVRNLTVDLKGVK